MDLIRNLHFGPLIHEGCILIKSGLRLVHCRKSGLNFRRFRYVAAVANMVRKALADKTNKCAFEENPWA